MHACFFVMLYCVCELCVVSLLRLLQFMLCLAISRRVWLLAAMLTTALSTSLLASLAVACDAHSLLSEQ